MPKVKLTEISGLSNVDPIFPYLKLIDELVEVDYWHELINGNWEYEVFVEKFLINGNVQLLRENKEDKLADLMEKLKRLPAKNGKNITLAIIYLISAMSTLKEKEILNGDVKMVSIDAIEQRSRKIHSH